MSGKKKAALILGLLLAVGLVVISVLHPPSPPAPFKNPDVAYLFSVNLESGPGELDVRFDRELDNLYHRLTFNGDRIRLERIAGRDTRLLIEKELTDLSSRSTLQILRRMDRAIVLLDHQRIFSINQLDLGSDHDPVLDVTGEMKVTSVRMQPLGNIFFSDDFMREKPSGQWRTISGAWEICSTSFAGNSSNPFCLYTRGRLSPDVEELHEERAGSEFTGIGIQLSPGQPFPNIVRVTGNSPAAEGGMGLGDQLVAVNGKSTRNVPFPEVFRRLQGKEGTEVQVTLLPANSNEERTLKLIRLKLKWGEIDKRVKIQPYRVEDSALLAAGPSFWDQFHFECSAKSRGRGSVGLAFHVRDARNFFALCWWGDAPDSKRSHRLEIVHVVEGTEKILASSAEAGGPVPFNYYRLGVEVGTDSIIGKIDGKEFIRAETDELAAGAIGLYAANSDGVYFDDVLVTSDKEDITANRKPNLPENIRTDPFMRAWANPGSEWLPPHPVTNVLWHGLTFEGDVQVHLKSWPEIPARLIFAGDGNRPASGYLFKIDPATKKIRLYRGYERKGMAQVSDADSLPIVFGMKKNVLTVSADEKILFEWADKSPLRGRRIGVKAMDVSTLEVKSPEIETDRLPYVFEETFTSAPVDWEIQGGSWGMMNRWICDPRWSWFGGHSRGVATVWNRRTFKGDVTVEIYAGFMMVRQNRPTEHPTNLGLSICGNGKHLFSGYTFLIGGNENHWTSLFRKEVPVYETRDRKFLLPVDRGDRNSLDAAHKSWLHVKLNKRGERVTCWYQGRKAFEYDDPQPLDLGQVAVWTVNNGILLGRVRIMAEEVAGRSIPFRDYSRHDGRLLSNWVDGQMSARLEEIERNTFRLTNLLSGGPFSVQLKTDAISPDRGTVLRFECKFDPLSKIDLYFKTDRQNFKYVLTGPDDARAAVRTGFPPEAVKIIGHAEQQLDDGRWHTVHLHLGRLIPGLRKITRIMFANYSNKDYLLAGRTGNPPGAVFYLRNIQLGSFE